MNDELMINGPDGEPISFREYLEQASIVFQCPPREALEKLIETAGMDEVTASQLREACERLYGSG